MTYFEVAALSGARDGRWFSLQHSQSGRLLSLVIVSHDATAFLIQSRSDLFFRIIAHTQPCLPKNREATPLPFNSATTKLSTPESTTDKVGASAKNASSGGPKAFKFGTPSDKVTEDKAATPTRKLFAAPEVKLSTSSVSNHASRSVLGETHLTLPQ